MSAIVHRAGAGDSLFDGRIVLKSELAELSVTESWFATARPGADPHLHRAHADSFYVLEGELVLLIGDQEHVLGPGACACAPPGVVHSFRSLTPARFLNLHTPDGGFAANLRAIDRGEPGGFDSVDAEPGSGLRGSGAILLHPGEGERFASQHRVATVKIGREELAVIEFELEPSFEGPDLHVHDDHTDAFYVLEGEIEFQVGETKSVGGPGTFVAATPGVLHTFTNGGGRSRLLNIHAPSADFHNWLREVS